MKKIPRSAKIVRDRRSSRIGSPRNFLNSIIFKLDKNVVLLGFNYIAGRTVQITR